MRLFIGLMIFFMLIGVLVKIMTVIDKDFMYTFYQIKTITIIIVSAVIISGFFYFLFKNGVLKYKK
jgi:hypothetical protein